MLIRKSSGEKEQFNLQKFRTSLQRAGADKKTIDAIVTEIKNRTFRNTNELHQMAIQLLQEYAPPVADRYNLKHALMELGPAGYPFELYIAQLFIYLGYETATNQLLQGFCVEHEVDIRAKKKGTHSIIECKFHNRRGLKSDVKVTLYVQARFEDIKQGVEHTAKETNTIHNAWVVTNTRFTSEAIRYAQCRSLELLAWNYPFKNSLAQLVTKYTLFPITTLTSLNKSQKRTFIKKGFILCKDAPQHKHLLKSLGFSSAEINKIVKEALAVCKL